MELIYILTYDCNFRCKYCDINKRKDDISDEIINKSFDFIEKNKIKLDKIKFFGGEPLIKKNFIKKIISNFQKKIKINYFLTTNASLINDNFFKYSTINNLNITISLDGDIITMGENRISLNGPNLFNDIIEKTKKYNNIININQVITSKNAENFFENFKFIYDLGVRNFNFLPEYYSEWSKKGLKNLKLGFDEILNFTKNGNNFNLINLKNYSKISFFNLGLIIDTDGKIYGTNLILSGKFEKYKNELIIGDVYNGLLYDILDNFFIKKYINDIEIILKKEYSNNILQSVKYVDLLLNNFCTKF